MVGSVLKGGIQNNHDSKIYPNMPSLGAKNDDLHQNLPETASEMWGK
jgi:hypothetical protein